MKYLTKANGLNEHILINKNEMKISPPQNQLSLIKRNIRWSSILRLQVKWIWALLPTVSAKEINDIIVIECGVLKTKAEFEMQIRIYWIFYDTVNKLKNSGLLKDGRNG